MHIKQSTVYWIIIFLALGAFVYLVSDILFPFVFAAVLAYFLDPVADKIESYGLSRTNSTISVICGFGLTLGVVLFFLGPVFMDQFRNLSVKFPQIFSEFELKEGSKLNKLVEKYTPGLEEKVKDFAYKFSVQIVQFIATSLQGILTSGKAIFNFISLIVISPVVAFYLLRDWDVLVKKVDDLLPRANLPFIRNEFIKIDDTVSAYIRGQVTVCLIMALFYSINLSLIGLDYAIAIGILSGILTFIPYVGVAIGLVVALIIAFFQFSSVDGMLFVLFIFGLGNLIEGNFITPKLVGDKVNLHPLWIIFGLLAGASILGFTGVMLAIPLTAIIGVLVRSLIAKYRKSNLYLGYQVMALEAPGGRVGTSSKTKDNRNVNSSAKNIVNSEESIKNADVFGFEPSKPRRGRPPKKVE